jgi:xanthine dehydrogenase accessory factor
MDDLFPQLEALSKSERRVAMATLVATKGTTPKKEGAKMWVGAGGRVLGSVTIGGCVDARVIAESEGVLGGGGARHLKMALGDEDAWEMGFSCGGTVEVLVEPLELGGGDAVVALYRRIDEELSAGRGACLVRLLSAPARALLVLQSGRSEGSLGDPALDRLAIARAPELIARGTSRSEPLGARRNEGAEAAQSANAGEGPEAFFEVHAPRPHLILFGAGHVSMPIVAIGKQLGFRSTVIDPRPRFASRERFPDADELKVGIASELAARIKYGPQSAVVITIHDYKVEVPVLQAVLATAAGYVGMLGNRRRGQAVLDALRERGLSEEQVGRVRVPIGLDLGAQSAAEIALGVLAEIVAARRGKSTQGLSKSAPVSPALPSSAPRSPAPAAAPVTR